MPKGANVPVPSSAVRIEVGWRGAPDADASALLVASGKVRSDTDFVFYNQPAHPSGAVRYEGKRPGSTVLDVLFADLTRIEPQIDGIIVAASTEGGAVGLLDGLFVRVVEVGSESEVARFDSIGATSETAVVLGELYRRDGGWKFRAVGQGYTSGLAGLATDYGISVDEAPAPPHEYAPPPPPPAPSHEFTPPPPPTGAVPPEPGRSQSALPPLTPTAEPNLRTSPEVPRAGGFVPPEAGSADSAPSPSDPSGASWRSHAAPPHGQHAPAGGYPAPSDWPVAPQYPTPGGSTAPPDHPTPPPGQYTPSAGRYGAPHISPPPPVRYAPPGRYPASGQYPPARMPAPAAGQPVPPGGNASGAQPSGRLALTRESPSVSLIAHGANSGIMRINLNWTASGISGPAALDLDLCCFWELADGRKGDIRPVGDFGSLERPPFIRLDADDRSGASAAGENLELDLGHAAAFRRILIFATLYDGADDLRGIRVTATLYPASAPPIELSVDGCADGSRDVVLALVENTGAELVVRREGRFVPPPSNRPRWGVTEVDKAYGWGLDWVRGTGKS
ncbi:TerD family protein [Nocardia sp. NPDC004573]